MTRKLTNRELKAMLLHMSQEVKRTSPVDPKTMGYLIGYSLLGDNFQAVMRRAKRLALVLHMVIFDRGMHIEFRTWKRGY
jgi:hypothetical protein